VERNLTQPVIEWPEDFEFEQVDPFTDKNVLGLNEVDPYT